VTGLRITAIVPQKYGAGRTGAGFAALF